MTESEKREGEEERGEREEGERRGGDDFTSTFNDKKAH